MDTNFLFVFCLLVCIAEAKIEYKLFNVMNYGARSDDRTDNSKAFLKAWSDACRWRGKSTVLIPHGSYMLNEVIFSGPCNAWMNFQIEGRLKASSDIYSFKTDSWISFRYVNNLYVGGGGTLDGQGAFAWEKNDCQKNRNCRALPATMTFQFVTNGYIHHMRSINSKQNHFTLYECKNMVLTKLKLIAPFNSPNTDGIKIAMSTGITITSVNIGTGDDCIAMLYGTRGVRISNVFCGPGHGISIGSLGKNNGEEDVDDIVVKNCTFSGTNNGVRIKTWSSILQKTMYVSNIHYEDIVMHKVQNPIIIDQNYCPSPPCNAKGGVSSVQISNVSYKYIRGSGNANVAASLQCSPNKPCQNITMENINLWPSGKGRKLNNECLHVYGASYGTQIPRACI
ncbi:exopolygalacturonase-like [Vicia villosa]|uniref:exopolygalacturonase-like n=1 Tax=Vicia villosa TaxID=3911 RepID=UPI00273C95D3|nr:exopolygalacturonase-like [Vicia villosa]